MNDFIEALKNRLNSPIFGYFCLALIAFNWEGFFYLIVQKEDVLGRIKYFNENTSQNSLILYPLLFSFGFSLVYPWINLIIAWFTAKPLEMKEILQAKSENSIILHRKQLEDVRSSVLASAEQELIERAKRDQELEGFQSEDIKSKLKMELDQLRLGRDSLRENNHHMNLQVRHKELMEIADTYRKRSKESSSYDDQREFLHRARELEEQAHRLIQGSEFINENNNA